MKRLPRRPLLVTAIVLSGMTSLAIVLYLVFGFSPGADINVGNLYLGVMSVLLLTWLAADPDLPVECRPSFDHVYLHYVMFPILAIYEQCVVRGWRGIAVLSGLLLILFAPYFVGLLVTELVR